jgi:phosphatidylserine/phosphatidylglycerophosphate/cardiolipin synthase-like enzyme
MSPIGAASSSGQAAGMTLGIDSTTLLESRPEASQAGSSSRAFRSGATRLARPRAATTKASLDEWFLTVEERGNPATRLDSRHRDGAAWTTGNRVRPLLHGAAYFAELLAGIRAMQAGDLLLFTDWRGDPDERLDGPGTEVARVLAEAASRGVIVRGLLWRSHMDRFRFSLEEHRDLGEAIVAAGGECLLDMRVRTRGSHHQKLVVLRHAGRPERDVAYVGGIDLCHGRRDDHAHGGDEQPCPLGSAYGPRPPWHDVQLAIQGPAVADVETVFRERWEDPTPLTRNPLHRWCDRILRVIQPPPCRTQLPDPQPCGTDAVQVLRTYPYRRRGYPFAPAGERSIARAYRKALSRARHLVYLEDQYLWSPHVVGVFAEALAANPGLRLIAVVPRFPITGPNQAWGATGSAAAPELLARARSLDLLSRLGGARVGIYDVENHAGIPVYVHAKVCVVDDTWATVGSGNVNRRSWTYDTELGCAVIAQDPGEDCLARSLRLALAREHLDRTEGDDADLRDPRDAFDVFTRSANRLDDWYAGGRRGSRPAGRLRHHHAMPPPAATARWAEPLYRILYDPDGRPRPMRRTGTF